MKGVIADLHIPYEACFKRPGSGSVSLTFPVPPFTTLKGMCANACGLHWDAADKVDDFFSKLQVNIAPLTPIPEPAEVLSSRLKLGGKSDNFKIRDTEFPTSPIHEYVLINPSYRMYAAADDGWGEKLIEGLKSPARGLYLGRSDDMVIVEIQDVYEDLEEKNTERLKGLVPRDKAKNGGEVIRLPASSKEGKTDSWSPPLLIPEADQEDMELSEEVKAWFFSDDDVGVLLF